MLQETALRLTGLQTGGPVVVCNEAHRFLVAEQLRQSRSIRSPFARACGRNTAPAIALAALARHRRGQRRRPLLLVLPADHVIRVCPPSEGGACGLPAALQAAGHFRIVPKTAERAMAHQRGPGGRRVPDAKFVEKPDLRRASVLAAGDHYWTAVCSCSAPARYLEELKRFAPVIAGACRAPRSRQGGSRFHAYRPRIFEACPSDSIDYAVMERPLIGGGGRSIG